MMLIASNHAAMLNAMIFLLAQRDGLKQYDQMIFTFLIQYCML